MILLASIPSPGHSTIDLGPFAIHFYGLMLLIAIAAAIGLTGIRFVHRGGNWDLIFQAAVWGVLAGVVGARLYHDVTSWNEVSQIHHWWAPFAVWKGGLGVYGESLRSRGRRDHRPSSRREHPEDARYSGARPPARAGYRPLG